ncbi:uncharacterized protein LOC142549876 isoform X1 [Primulina tabacum]|uniref:uncharacterized protein LOC142549876 isoform X1 n=1 Tax=Primulina tabacum TaxID=48773 RepID=UPI003F5A656D
MVRKDSGVSSPSHVIHCLDQLREELSCAICLEICYEPSTTPCGHGFCKQGLCSAADKCGKRCPKCRQLISNWRFCTVNTLQFSSCFQEKSKKEKQGLPRILVLLLERLERKIVQPELDIVAGETDLFKL